MYRKLLIGKSQNSPEHPVLLQKISCQDLLLKTCHRCHSKVQLDQDSHISILISSYLFLDLPTLLFCMRLYPIYHHYCWLSKHKLDFKVQHLQLEQIALMLISQCSLQLQNCQTLFRYLTLINFFGPRMGKNLQQNMDYSCMLSKQR